MKRTTTALTAALATTLAAANCPAEGRPIPSAACDVPPRGIATARGAEMQRARAETPRALPPIDAAAPLSTVTATFALG